MSLDNVLGQYNIFNTPAYMKEAFSTEVRNAFTTARDYFCENKVFVISTIVTACLNPVGFVTTTAATAIGLSAYYISPFSKVPVSGQSNAAGIFQSRMSEYHVENEEVVQKVGTCIPLFSVSGKLQMLPGAFECCLTVIKQAAAFLQKVPAQPFSISVCGVILGAKLAKMFALKFFEDCEVEKLQMPFIENRVWITQSILKQEPTNTQGSDDDKDIIIET